MSAGRSEPASPPAQTAGDALPAGCVLIEVRVAELQQLFNSMDPSPFRDRDLDPDAEDFIVGWAREAPRRAPLTLLVELNRAPGLGDEAAILRDAIRVFFAHRAQASRARLRQLLGVGRTSLLVGLCFLIVAVGLGGLAAGTLRGFRLGELIQQGLSICGWVAMWRPLEIFLYGWWPIRTEARLYDRLSAMPVRVRYSGTATPDAWRHDWPAAPPQKASRRAAPQPSGDSPAVVPERGPVAAELSAPARLAPK